MRRSPRGFTLIELMVTVAIAGVLVALAGNAMTGTRRVGRVAGEARLVMRRLQSARTAAVAQGAPQGYLVGPNGNAVADPHANQAFRFVKQPSTIPPPVTFATGVDTVRDTEQIPVVGQNALVQVTAKDSGAVSIPSSTPFSVGFDLNGRPFIATYDAAYAPTATPVTFPFCLRIRDVADISITRFVVLFGDGSVKVQRDETYCS